MLDGRGFYVAMRAARGSPEEMHRGVQWERGGALYMELAAVPPRWEVTVGGAEMVLPVAPATA